MAKFLSNINLETANDIQFKTTAGANAGKISQTGDDLVISNAVGDILLGNGSDDVYIGDGTNAVDIRFEQNMSIFADSGSAKTLTIGGANTNLVLDSPSISGTMTLGATTINNKLTFTTANGYILFDYEPSGDTGEYTTEVPLLKVDLNGSEKTILSRISENGAIQLGHDDTVLITAGDVGDVMKTNWGATNEAVVLAAENGFYAYGFPDNNTTWANRNEFVFYSSSATAANNGLYIGDGSSTQFIDINRNLKNIGTIASGVITATELTTASQGDISTGTSYQQGTVSAAQPVMKSSLLAHSPESNESIIHPYIFNDLANFVARGGTVTYGGLSDNPTSDETARMFEPNARTANATQAEITGSTWSIELTDFPRALNYGARIGISFGSPSFAPSSMLIEYSTDNGSSYTTALNSSVQNEYYHTYVANGASGVNAIKFTLGKLSGNNGPRVMNIYAYNYDSRGMSEYFVDKGGDTLYGNLSVGSNSLTAGSLDINGAADISGNLVVGGNLTVNGTTVTVDTTNLNVQDKNITLNYSTSDSSASADGAGITIQDAVDSSTDATILWDATNDEFDFSHAINVTGNIGVSGTVDGRDIATDGTKLDGIATSANNYVHPTNAGNKHIPAGGASGNFLKYSSAGTAVWSTPTKSDVGLGNVSNVDQTNASNITSGTLAASRVATLNQNTTGSAASLSDLTLGQIVYGGESGYAKLDGNTASSNKFLRSRGTGSSATEPAWANIGYNDLSGTVPTWNQNTTGTAAGLSSTLAVSSGGTGATSLDAAGIVEKSGSQTISGTKTFTGSLLLDDGTGASPTMRFMDANDNEVSIFCNTSGKMKFQQKLSGGSNVVQMTMDQNGLDIENGLTVGTGATITTILDEDDMASDSDTALATQQSIKAYVTSSVAGAGGGTMSSFLLAASGTANTATIEQGDTITFSAGTGITATRSGNQINIANSAPAGSTHLNSNTTKSDVGLSNVENTALSTYTGSGGALDNQYITNGAGYTTNTGTTTADNTQTFTNKSGNISQWTNDSNYLTDFSGLAQSDIPSDSINTSKLAHGSVGQVIAFTTNGVPTLVSAGSAGQVLTANSNSHPTFQDATGSSTDTTYDLTCSQNSGSNTNPKLVLTGSDSTQDSITITGSGATSVTRTSNGGFTISSTDTNTNTQLTNSQVKAAITASAAADTIISSDELLFLDNSDSDEVKKGDVGDLAAALTDNTGGLTTSSGIIKVNTGAGITIDTNALKIQLNPTNTGLQLDQSNGLSVLLAASGGIATDGGNALTLNSDITSVDTLYNTALHVGNASNAMHCDYSAASATGEIRWYTSTTEVMALGYEGNLEVLDDVTADSQVLTSDRRLKKNIEPLNYGLDEVLKLKPVRYEWKESYKKGKGTMVGFVSQDVQEVIPEVINESRIVGTEKTKLGIDYSKIVAVLTNAIQEQQKQIDELKKLINGNTN